MKHATPIHSSDMLCSLHRGEVRTKSAALRSDGSPFHGADPRTDSISQCHHYRQLSSRRTGALILASPRSPGQEQTADLPLWPHLEHQRNRTVAVE